VCACCFAYASWSDWKIREVSDRVWVVLALFGLVLTPLDLWSLSRPHLLVLSAVSVLVSFALSFAFFYLNLFGGADAKALVCLSLIMPYYPTSFRSLLGLPVFVFPLSVFCNSIIFASLTTLYLLGLNALRRVKTGRLFEGFEDLVWWRKAFLLFLGYKTPVVDLTGNGHAFPIEHVSKDEAGRPVRTIRFSIKASEEQDAAVEELVEAFRQGVVSGEVWVSPALPLLVFVTAGFFVTLTLGDLVLWVVYSLLG
jgi:preflagellin peptidase FlaK